MSTTGAGTVNVEKKPCGWVGGDCKHTEIKKTLEQDGKVNREDGSIRGWARPNGFSANSPKNEDQYRNPEDFVSVPERWGKDKRYVHDYLIQRHHVIPCAALTGVPELKENLKSLGWDINDQQNNGICLPAYDEGIFWHDMPRHCGWTNEHASYNADVKEELNEEWKSWRNLCKQDREQDLLAEVQDYVDWVRDLIVQWDDSVFLVRNGGNRRASFLNAGYQNTPSKAKHKNRTYS